MKHDNKVIFQIEIQFSSSVIDYKGVQDNVLDALVYYANSAGLKPDDEGGYTRLITVSCLSAAIPTIRKDPFPIEEILTGVK